MATHTKGQTKNTKKSELLMNSTQDYISILVHTTKISPPYLQLAPPPLPIITLFIKPPWSHWIKAGYIDVTTSLSSAVVLAPAFPSSALGGQRELFEVCRPTQVDLHQPSV